MTVLVLGGSGFVGSRLVDVWRSEGLQIAAPSHAELDVLDTHALANATKNTRAEVVVNLAAGAHVDLAEAEAGDKSGRVYALNAILPGRLATLCGEFEKHLVHVSTDYVFDGTNAERPYREDDLPNPISWYAVTKYHGEQRILESGAPACVARIEMPFSGRNHQKSDLPRTVVARLKAGQPIAGVIDQRITPVFLDDAVHALRIVAEKRHQGIVHIAATDWTTPFRFARSIASRLELDPDLVQPAHFEVFAGQRPARRPQHSWLDVSLFAKLYGQNVLRPIEAELDAWHDQLLSVSSRA